MKNHIKLTKEVLNDCKRSLETDIQGSLQAHLRNALTILDLMNLDAKPLLVFFSDCTNSLFELQKKVASAKLKRKEANGADNLNGMKNHKQRSSPLQPDSQPSSKSSWQ